MHLVIDDLAGLFGAYPKYSCITKELFDNGKYYVIICLFFIEEWDDEFSDEHDWEEEFFFLPFFDFFNFLFFFWPSSMELKGLVKDW